MCRSSLTGLLILLSFVWLAGCSSLSAAFPSASLSTQTQTVSPVPSTPTKPVPTPTDILPVTQPSLTPTLAAPMKIRQAWFYKPPQTGLENLPANYEFFILTHNDEAARDRLKALGVQTPVLQYLLMNEIMDPGGCDKPPRNDQVAFKPGDYCWIQNNYPDWFLTGQNGQVLGQGQYDMMDAGNDGWRKFWMERATLLQESYQWDGVFLDNVEASLSKMVEWGTLPAAYPDDATYQAAIENELKELYTGYFHPNGRPVFANIIAINDPQVWLRYLQYLDGAMLENFATGWPGETGLSLREWEQQMQMVTQAQALGKTVILVAQGDRYDKPRQEFALASYLLVNDGLAYFRYTNHSVYEEDWAYANQNLDLGAPLGVRYRVGQSWRRDFSNGFVVVDPVTRTAAITIY